MDIHDHAFDAIQQNDFALLLRPIPRAELNLQNKDKAKEDCCGTMLNHPKHKVV